ncbi:hypothetical protein GJ629_12425 [Halapricum sp. CBA1109]|uniref:hypothetical protein n=1 Tax=Halapricum sp. CBA1109 TaxID=2668068 RepID=UPI0012FB30C8|nr:hypothetical protein [Halapricum sp. CBA1109]MUV90604.1 hypothetical protein [Halapricum sp. CBA1109]
MTIQRHIVVLSLSLFIVVGSLTGGVGAVPALTEEVSTNATGHATSVSLAANDQTTDGSRIDIASYDLSTEGETLAVWSLSNGSLDTVIGSVAPDTLSGTIEIELDQTLQENQTVAVAVHSSQPMTDNVIVSDRAELTIETVPASVTFNDQTSSGQSVDIAAYTLGSDGETVAVWSVTEDGSPDQVLASVAPSS